jgi:hypothetical protein
MGRIFEGVLKFFEEEDWPIETREGHEVVRTGYVNEQGRWRCYVVVDEEKSEVAFYSLYPDPATPDRYGAVAEFLHRANYGLVLGNFELNYADGEIRFRTGLDVENVELSSDLLTPLIYANVAQMGRYFGGLKQVLANGASPEAVIHTIESQT